MRSIGEGRMEAGWESNGVVEGGEISGRDRISLSIVRDGESLIIMK